MKERFKCTVFEQEGKKSEIIREAENEDELIRSFSTGALTLLAYKKLAQKQKKVSHTAKNTVILFTESMSALLASGLSVQEALVVCGRITEKRSVSKLCSNLSESLSEGKTLHESLHMYGTFPSLYIPMVRIGEMTASISQVFSRLSNYLLAKKELSRKLAASLFYPVTVCITALFVVLCMILFVFPKLSDVFEVFTASAPTLEKRIQTIKLSFVITGSLFVFLILLTVLVLYLRRLSVRFAEAADRIFISVPILSKYIKISETNDFAFAMELLCSSGLSVTNSLEQSSLVIKNESYRKALLSVTNDVKNGALLSQSMKKHKEFPSYIVTWLGIGEETGSVERAFSQIRSYYEKELSSILSNLAARAEPMFILVAGILIFTLVGQFVLPIFSMLGEL